LNGPLAAGPAGVAPTPAASAPQSAQPDPPQWGRQASLIQPGEPAFWLYVGLLAIGAYFFYGQQSLMSALTNAYLLSWALVLVYAVPVAFVVYRLDLFEREPKILLAAAVIWGGVIATSLAAQANSAWLDVLGKVSPPDFTAQWGKAIVGPGVEETLNGPMDGFVYGAMVGLGFTVVEDVSYFINAVAAAPGAVDQSGPVFDTFIIRVVGGGLYGHVLFTGLTGTGFAYLVTRRRASTLRRVGAVACVAAGVAAHVVWNSPLMESVLRTGDGGNPTTLQWVEYGTIKGAPFLLLLVILVIFATRSEEKDFRAIVAGEADPSVIAEPEIRSLRSLLARRAARNEARRLYGPVGAKLMGQLQAAQIQYAMIRSRSHAGSEERDRTVELQRQRIRAIRSRIEALPQTSAGR
jgi:RsiW-degrading membrane proteinase PrsW (M82 family)